MSSMSLRQTAVLIALFVVTSTGLIALDRGHHLDAVKVPATQLLEPVERAFTGLGHGIASLGGDDSDLARQLEQVTAERDRLLAENARLRQLEEEVVQLRKQLGFRNARPELRVISANVIGRDPQGLEKYLVIDRGAEDGIQTGMAVVSPDFYVGQVTEVDRNQARVTLAIDARSQVGAMLQDSRADGVLYGRWQAGGRMELRHLDPETDVQEGALVVTSGQTARVPAGLVVGKVYRIDRDVQADSLTAQVTPLIDFDQLRSVTVILDASTSAQREGS